MSTPRAAGHRRAIVAATTSAVFLGVLDVTTSAQSQTMHRTSVVVGLGGGGAFDDCQPRPTSAAHFFSRLLLSTASLIIATITAVANTDH